MSLFLGLSFAGGVTCTSNGRIANCVGYIMQSFSYFLEIFLSKFLVYESQLSMLANIENISFKYLTFSYQYKTCRVQFQCLQLVRL